MTQRATAFHRLPLLRRDDVGDWVVLNEGNQVLTAEMESLRAVAIGQEPEVADFDEASGQDMEKEAADKFHCFQTHHLEGFAILRVAPLKTDTTLSEAYESAIGDGHAVGIPSQIFEDVLGAAQGRRGVDHSFGLAELIEPSMKLSRVGEPTQLPVKAELPLGQSLSQKAQQLALEQTAKNLDGQEEFVPTAYPA